jgi:protein-tyrosine phosphatase
MRGEVHPIRGPWRGQLAILARPRGNDWLSDEIQSWREAGIDVVVSLLTAPENLELGLVDESKVAKNVGINFVSFPISDYSVPASEEAVLELSRNLNDMLSMGKCVGIHCRQSIGRSGLIAACLLVVAGETPADAFEQVIAGRGAPVPDTLEQQNWVYTLANNLRSGSTLSLAE